MRFLIKIKIYLTLNFFYPISKKFKKIRSIIPSFVDLSDSCVVEKEVQFGCDCKIGKHVFIGEATKIYKCSQIGSFSSISSGVRIGLVSHPQNFISTSPIFYSSKRGWLSKNSYSENSTPVEIGSDVLISMNVLIMPGVKIGHGAIIGAGSFVNKDIPPYSIVGGVPAKVLKYRFDADTISKLLESEWWNKPDDILKKYLNFANEPITFVQRIESD